MFLVRILIGEIRRHFKLTIKRFNGWSKSLILTKGGDLIFYYFNFMVKRERPEAFLKNFQIRAIIHWPGGFWADNTMLT